MLDVGFKSRKTFYNAFKLFTGLSPITFKKNLER
jgi:methylphosphotriester-DNA--protein-cysteine methyltransferase